MSDQKSNEYIQVIYRQGNDGTRICFLPGKIVDEELMEKCRKYIHIDAQDHCSMERHSRIYKEVTEYLSKNFEDEISVTPEYPFAIVGIIHIFLSSVKE